MEVRDLVRALTSWSGPRTALLGAPWESFVDWAIGDGLGSLAGYQLEYRPGLAGAPDWVREKLLSVHQATLNDNVMKLVQFKRAIGELEGRRVVLFGSASYVDELYPHAGFRPVSDIQLLVDPSGVAGLANFLHHAEFRDAPAALSDYPWSQRALDDTRTVVCLSGSIGRTIDVTEIIEAATPIRAYGPSVFRPNRLHAMLLHASMMGMRGFAVPAIELVDFRELVLGAQAPLAEGTPAVDWDRAAETAHRWGVARALYASLRAVEDLFPQVGCPSKALHARVGAPARVLLEEVVVRPVTALGARRMVRGADILRALFV